MKKLLMIVAALVAMNLSGAAKDRVINQPTYDARNSPTVTVDQIRLTDTATVLRIVNRYIPGWWINISPDTHLHDAASGIDYHVRSTKGIELGAQHFMPTSGCDTVLISFEPLAKDAKIVDLVMDDDQVNSIFGLNIAPSTKNSSTADRIAGNWYATDGSGEWTLGLYAKQKLAIYDNTFWNFALDEKKGLLTLSARNDPQSKIELKVKKGIVGNYSREQKTDSTYRFEAPKHKAWEPGTFLKRDSAVVRGFIDGYSPKLGFAKAMIRSQDILSQNDETFLVDIAPDGTFQTMVSLQYPSELMLQIENSYISIHVSQRDTLMVYLNMDDISLCVYGYRRHFADNRFMGRNGAYNDQINRYYAKIAGFDIQKHFRELAPADFDKFNRERLAQEQKANQEYIARTPLTPNAKFYIATQPAIECAYNLLAYESQRRYHLSKDSTVDNRGLDLPTDFYTFVGNVPLDDQRILAFRYYFSLINMLEYHERTIAERLPDFDMIEKISGIKADKDLRLFCDSMANGSITLTKENIKSCQAKLAAIDSEQFRPYALMTQLERRNAKFKEIFGISPCFTTQVVASSTVRKKVESGEFQATPHTLSLILPNFQKAYIIEALLAACQAKEPKPIAAIAPEKPQANAKPADDAEKLMDSLMKPYAGKVVYLDFWAIWCGPCRGGMIDSYNVKDKLKDKNVAFVYITTEKDSPTTKREAFIKDNKIAGEFLIVSSDEWNVLAAKHNINGIPRYMIVGKDGKIVNNNIYEHGDQLISTLSKLAD